MVFGLENTLIASNVVSNYAWLATQNMGALQRTKFMGKILAEVPSMLSLDSSDRTDFLRYFYLQPGQT